MFIGGLFLKIKLNPTHATFFLAVFFSVGTIGMLISAPLFQALTPFHLGLTALVLLWFSPEKNANFIRFVILVLVAGFAVELVGVKTGKIFGSYQYGYALGAKMGGVPLIIGVNWLIMVLSTMSLSEKLPLNDFGKSLSGALFMTLLDFLIEQVAPVYHFWYFDDLRVPLRNYLAWFFVGALFHYFGRQLDINPRNPMGTSVFLMLFLFFLILSAVNFFM